MDTQNAVSTTVLKSFCRKYGKFWLRVGKKFQNFYFQNNFFSEKSSAEQVRQVFENLDEIRPPCMWKKLKNTLSHSKRSILPRNVILYT